MPHISVIIPVFKAENCLDVLYSRLTNSLEKITLDYEIIFVEDCGEDASWKMILDLNVSDYRINGIKLSRNFGQHYAITAGLDYCKGDWAIIMDCDLQDQPEEIFKLYQKATEGYDVVLANRGKRNDTFWKRSTSWLFYKIFNYFLELDYNGNVGNFCIISQKVVLNLRQMREQLRFFGGLVNWMGFPKAIVDVKHAERYDGKSTYTLKKLFKLASDCIIAYSDKPLKLAVKLGFIMSTLAFIYGIYILIRALIYSSPVLGWSSLIVSLYFISGIIIAILGIIGIYLGKTFDETKKRPLYIIAQITSELTQLPAKKA
jgi:polyisoprenyl-phosphate glycosyltransferase